MPEGYGPAAAARSRRAQRQSFPYCRIKGAASPGSPPREGAPRWTRGQQRGHCLAGTSQSAAHVGRDGPLPCRMTTAISQEGKHSVDMGLAADAVIEATTGNRPPNPAGRGGGPCSSSGATARADRPAALPGTGTPRRPPADHHRRRESSRLSSRRALRRSARDQRPLCPPPSDHTASRRASHRPHRAGRVLDGQEPSAAHGAPH